ncbi:hypothetical protein Poly30_20390 [Planctomycetes bacterium Poly30]|uniref:Prepilin-type N-terminal cleavage/methylation domain-containing protein n=1 Tax=Saltatorellus ferox TaxID=2528018 RepID=A0A518ER14_9BACT|nr:hypothetical protein Poly30_20390 [Planctomycetes bacterium Poly30]
MRIVKPRNTSRHGRDSRGRAGFTLVETILASTLFVGVGYVLLMSSQASQQSHRTVSMNVESNGTLREFTDHFQDELRSANRETLVLDQPAAGNATLRFQTAINGGGAEAWGVFDRRLSPDEAACNRDGWFIQYAVEQGGLALNELVRRVIDTNGDTQLMHVMATNVVRFSVDSTGEVWVVRLETLGDEGRREDEFDVRIRNE